MKFKAKVLVYLKKSILDAQGNTTLHALKKIGLAETESLRIGKYFDLTLEASSQAEAEKKVKSMSEQVLANTVMEDFSIEVKTVAEKVGF